MVALGDRAPSINFIMTCQINVALFSFSRFPFSPLQKRESSRSTDLEVFNQQRRSRWFPALKGSIFPHSYFTDKQKTKRSTFSHSLPRCSTINPSANRENTTKNPKKMNDFDINLPNIFKYLDSSINKQSTKRTLYLNKSKYEFSAECGMGIDDTLRTGKRKIFAVEFRRGSPPHKNKRREKQTTS